MVNSIVMAQSLGAKQKTLRKTVFTIARAFNFSRFPCTEVFFSYKTLDIAEPQNLVRHLALPRHKAYKPAQGVVHRKLSPPDGGHLGCGIWQRLPRFPPSPVTLCLNSVDPPEKTLSFCGGESTGDENGGCAWARVREQAVFFSAPPLRTQRFRLYSPKIRLRLFCRLKMLLPSSPSKFTGTAVLTISLLSLQGALWYFRPQPTGNLLPLNVVNIHGGNRELLDFNSSPESDQQLPSDHRLDHVRHYTYGRTNDHPKLVSCTLYFTV